MTASLERWNPLTPLAAALLLVSVAYAGPFRWSAAAALIAALAAAWGTGTGARVTRLAAAVGLPTFAFLFFMNGVIAVEGAPAVAVGPVSVAPGAARGAAEIALRLTAAVAALGWIVVGVSPRRLTQALAQRGLPAWAAYVVVASLEAVPQARRRAAEVLDAQRCRGLRLAGGTSGRLRALVALAGPLVVSLVTEAEERALALDARGFHPRRRRSALEPVEDRAGERALRAVLWLLLAAMIVWKVAR